jgi:broad specificity phosphatase PhoE
MDLKKTIYLTRHGSTAYNDDHRLQGVTDNSLSERGARQAELLAQRLKSANIEIVYHSPLARARETAEIINRHHHAELRPIPDFIEMDMGTLEGKDFFKYIKQNPEVYHRWISELDEALPGGESFNQVYQRVKKGADKILGCEFSTILIVAHAMVNRAVLGNLLTMPPLCSRRFRTENCSFSKLSVYDIASKPHVVVEAWNSVDHLLELDAG